MIRQQSSLIEYDQFYSEHIEDFALCLDLVLEAQGTQNQLLQFECLLLQETIYFKILGFTFRFIARFIEKSATNDA